MHRSLQRFFAAGLLLLGVGCQQPPRQAARPNYQRVPPSSKYTFVDVKRYRPDELAQIPRGSRCTVETTDVNRSVTGYVQESTPSGLVLVNAEEIVAKTEVPSNMNGKGYSHHPKDKVQLAAAEVASVRVFKE